MAEFKPDNPDASRELNVALETFHGVTPDAPPFRGGRQTRSQEGARTDGKPNYFKEQLFDHLRLYPDSTRDGRSNGRPYRRPGVRHDDEHAEHDRHHRDVGGEQIKCSWMDRAPSHFNGNRSRLQHRARKTVEKLFRGYRIRNGIWNLLVGSGCARLDAGEIEDATLPLQHHGLAVVDGPHRFRNDPWWLDGGSAKSDAQIIEEPS